MTDATPTPAKAPGKTQEARGTGFPVLALQEAADVVKAAGAHGRSHSPDALAAYAGHTSSNSGPFRRKVAALRDWGLITGTGDTLTLTDRAMRIAHPPSDAELSDAMFDAFRNCELFWKVFENTAKGVELTYAALANSAVNNHGVGVGSKDKFVDSLVDSAATVGLADKVAGEKVIFKARNAPSEGIGTNGATASNTGATEQKERRGESTPRGNAAAPVVKQVWPVRDGEISFEIRLTTPLPAAAFAQVGKIVEEVQRLAETLPSTGESSEPEDVARS